MDNLPYVSIITPTFNKKSFFKLAINNFLSFEYPNDKLEWIILDDSDESIKDILPNDKRIKYYYYDEEMKKNLHKLFIENYNEKKQDYKKNSGRQNKILKNKKYKLLSYHKKQFRSNRIPLGMKRNLCVQYASYDIIIHMDDDDFYPPKSIITRVNELLNDDVDCVGCSSIAVFHINKMISAIYNPEKNLSDSNKISVGTLAYKKKFWNEKKFENQDIKDEGIHFLKKRKCKDLHWKNIIIALFHSKNDSNIKIFNTEPNGWHFYPLSDDLFTMITNLDI
jgi:glycosyltransferase involved in cell wall biosynthesis